jgi:hypothetical protein
MRHDHVPTTPNRKVALRPTKSVMKNATMVEPIDTRLGRVFSWRSRPMVDLLTTRGR